MTRGTIEEVYEPFLIKEGFIKRTPRGRRATDLAYVIWDGEKQRAGVAVLIFRNVSLFFAPLYSKTLFFDHIKDKAEKAHEDDRGSTEDQARPVPGVGSEYGQRLVILINKHGFHHPQIVIE